MEKKYEVLERFVQLRKKLGLSQKQLSEYLEVDQSYISKIENGERSITLDIAEKICNLIGYDVSYLFNGENQESLNISFRAKELDVEDLKKLARVNLIAIKLREMKKLYEEQDNV